MPLMPSNLDLYLSRGAVKLYQFLLRAEIQRLPATDRETPYGLHLVDAWNQLRAQIRRNTLQAIAPGDDE
jgi:hypothetical protein